MRKSMAAVAVLVVLVCMSGCSGDKGTFQGLNTGQAADMNAARSQFERSNDPPLTADTHFAAGQLNETQGAFPLAIEQYKAALALNSNHVPSIFRLAVVYSQMKKYPEALEMWNRYVTVTDRSAAAYSNLAFCQELSGDPAAAEASYRLGIDRDPHSQACRVNYGLMLSRQGRLEDAKAQFSAVLAPAQVHYNLASVFQQQGKKDAARHEYNEAIKADPKFIDAQTRLVELDKN